MSLPLQVMALKREDNSVLEVSFNCNTHTHTHTMGEMGWKVYLMVKEATLC